MMISNYGLMDRRWDKVVLWNSCNVFYIHFNKFTSNSNANWRSVKRNRKDISWLLYMNFLIFFKVYVSGWNRRHSWFCETKFGNNSLFINSFIAKSPGWLIFKNHVRIFSFLLILDLCDSMEINSLFILVFLWVTLWIIIYNNKNN